MDDKLVIPIRKTSDFITAPFYFPMIQLLKGYFPEQYNRAMNEVKLGEVILDARSIQQLFRLDGIDFQNMNHEQLSEVIIKVTGQQSDPELTHYLLDIKNRLEDLIIGRFFKLIKHLPTQFLFPMLEYNNFKESLENGTNFTQEQESQIHRARARHNSSLKRISESMGISSPNWSCSKTYSCKPHGLHGKFLGRHPTGSWSFQCCHNQNLSPRKTWIFRFIRHHETVSPREKVTVIQCS
jgi:hypothetical protein